jgi:hypothetical protein
MVQFLIGFFQVMIIAFMIFEGAMMILGMYSSMMKSMDSKNYYDPSRLNICKVTPTFSWGFKLAEWALKEDKPKEKAVKEAKDEP